MADMVDCVVVGAGPAGLMTAIYLSRFGLTATVLEHGQSRAATIPHSRNFPGFTDGVVGRDLVQRMRDQLATYGVQPIHDEAVSAQRVDGGIEIKSMSGTYTGRTVFLATGVEDIKPKFVSDDEHDRALQSFLIHYCPICDGFEVTRKPAIVVGTGTHGVREALFLHSYANNISLFAADGPHALKPEERDKLRAAGVELVDGPMTPMRIDGNALVFEANGKSYRTQSVYGALGSRPRSGLAKQLGAELSSEGCIVTDPHQRTTVERLYAGGDIILGLDQITTAIGHGATGATTIRNDLYQWRTP